jgi:hypothetical protein
MLLSFYRRTKFSLECENRMFPNKIIKVLLTVECHPISADFRGGSYTIRSSVVITFYDTRMLSHGCYQDSCSPPFAAGLNAVGPSWNINLPLTW